MRKGGTGAHRRPCRRRNYNMNIMKKIAALAVLLFCLATLLPVRATAQDRLRFYGISDSVQTILDTMIFRAAKAHDVDSLLFKAICGKESSMQRGVNRAENVYARGKYAAEIKKKAKELQAYARKKYGVGQSVETYVWQMSMSWDLGQIMGIKAYELGWRGLSFANGDYGLINTDTALWYSAKLLKKELKRYKGDVAKAVSAYNAGTYTKRNYDEYVKIVLGYYRRFKVEMESAVVRDISADSVTSDCVLSSQTAEADKH